MDGILDFSRDLDVQLFDKVVNTFFGGHGTEVLWLKIYMLLFFSNFISCILQYQQKNAQTILAQFQEHDEAWTRVDKILAQSNSLQAKFIGLQILEKLIQTKWKILPREQSSVIRDYIVGTIIEIANDESAFLSQKVYLNKLNLVLVQILKHEWPKQWPDFVPELVNSSRTSLTLCENNMVILKLLRYEHICSTFSLKF